MKTSPKQATPNTSQQSSVEASLFDRPDKGERVLLVHVALAGVTSDVYLEEDIQEFHDLAHSSDVDIVKLLCVKRAVPDKKYFIGTGKADELKTFVEANDIEVVIFNQPLSPSQERNLEQLFKCRVLDRTTLILDIFAQRARTFEGNLQVELAQLRHMSTRLVRGWTHLERQKGGIGLRGPGETQLETDRRLLNQRIKQLERKLTKVRKQREQGRQSRQKAEVPTIALVGYTNAGKSTLFNALCSADVFAADKLFATLDPTLRRLDMQGIGTTIFADTVGFIKDLPHDLVAAFRSTLQETQEAELLLHVVDVHSELADEMIMTVNDVLAEIDASDVPQLLVKNKVDLIDLPPQIVRDEEGAVREVWLSAQSGEGIELLKEALTEIFASTRVSGWLVLTPAESKLRAMVHELGNVAEEKYDEHGNCHIKIDISKRDIARMRSQFNADLELTGHSAE